MSLSSRVAKVIACLLATVAIPAIILAQASFRNDGNEYSLSGAVPGDQVHSQLAINQFGGFLVWEDNVGGVRAVALDSSLSPVGNPFQISRSKVGYQEYPQVALLKGGGAVFVWQGGISGSQDIHARFLSSSNTWLTADMIIHTFTKNAQTQPRVAVLDNGNVVIVWTSFNQASTTSMQDVFGQIFSPRGQRLGAGFSVNQSIAFNQRSPAVAGLTNGGFVVAWVTEQQRSGQVDVPNPLTLYDPTNRPSVEIYFRIFDADANPATSELLANTSLNVAANPSIAAAADGGFMLAWGERDMINRSNSWDIVARPFSSTGSGGASRYVNSELFGDQYVPQISAVGNDYLVVWTSLGQDGAREGVYGQFLRADGSFAGGEFRVNTKTAGRQIHPGIASDSSGRFIVAWSSYARISSMDVYAKIYPSDSYVPNGGPPLIVYAAPTRDPFSTVVPPPSGGGVVAGNGKTLPFPPGTAFGQALPNPFTVSKGTYNGLIYDSSGVAVPSSGYFTASTTTRGSYTAKVMLAGQTYSVSGKFDASGQATNSINRAGSPLRLYLQMDLSGGGQMRGFLISDQWTAQLQADQLRPTAAAKYTFVIRGDPQNSSTVPGGDGIGTITVSSSGSLRFSAVLSDRAKITQGSGLSSQGYWPLCGALYSKNGALVSWIQFSSNTDSDLAGQLVWIKPTLDPAKELTYTLGFTNSVSAVGSTYRAPPAGGTALNLSSGTFALTGASLNQPLISSVTFAPNRKVIAPAQDKLTLTVTSSTGLFKGSRLNPDTGQMISFEGALFQKGNVGMGYFIGGNQSGEVYLSSGQ